MKTKITRVTTVGHDGKRTSFRPNIIVENIEEYRIAIKSFVNADMVLFDMEEIEEPTKN